jgi:hypothetical protein
LRLVQDYLRQLEALDGRFRGLHCADGGQRASTDPVVDLPLETLHRLAERRNFVFSVQSMPSAREVTIVGFNIGSQRTAAAGRSWITASPDSTFWRESETLRALLELAIEFWQADEATISRVAPPEPGLPAFWLRWEKNGVASPVPYRKPATSPSRSTAWHGGMLHEWPENEPVRLLGDPASS